MRILLDTASMFSIIAFPDSRLSNITAKRWYENSAEATLKGLKITDKEALL